MGEIELNIPRDRMGEYDPELIPKGTKDVSALGSCKIYCVNSQSMVQ